MSKDDYQTISICKSQRYATTPTAHKKYQGVYDIEKKTQSKNKIFCNN